MKFLVAKEATFKNLILDDDSDVWMKNLKIDGPPVVFVYDAAGKLDLVGPPTDSQSLFSDAEKRANQLLSDCKK